MRKLIALLILVISLFLSTAGFDATAGGHVECAENSALSSASAAPCACDHVAAETSAEPDHDGAHPCHIGHCSFTLKTSSMSVATALLVGMRSAPALLRPASASPADTLRPPARA